jgi:hypothetical protein
MYIISTKGIGLFFSLVQAISASLSAADPLNLLERTKRREHVKTERARLLYKEEHFSHKFDGGGGILLYTPKGVPLSKRIVLAMSECQFD